MVLSEARARGTHAVAVPAAAAAATALRDGGEAVVDAAVAGRQFDELVDRVVEAIETRVVDELERRGVHRVPGVF